MKNKLFVLSGSPQQAHELRERLGDNYDIVVCHSVAEMQRNIEAFGGSAAVNGTNSANGQAHYDMGEINGRTQIHDIDGLIDKIMAHEGRQEPAPRTLAARVDLIEQKIIESTLSRNRHHRKETAAELGISRVTLYNKMKKFGMLN
jgi:transcriptional regulator with GAF, ATPase, and Fis domain